MKATAMESMKMGDSGMRGMAMDSVKTTRHAEPVWTCPMHPEIVRDKPGTCPICGMDLVRKEPEARKVAVVGLNDLLRAGNGEVLSSVPVTAMQQETVTPMLEVFGRIAYDTRRISTISARVSGRIEKLYVRYRYQHVQRGQRIMDLYSPELIMGEQDLLFLLKNDPTNSGLIGAARERLRAVRGECGGSGGGGAYGAAFGHTGGVQQLYGAYPRGGQYDAGDGNGNWSFGGL